MTPDYVFLLGFLFGLIFGITYGIVITKRYIKTTFAEIYEKLKKELDDARTK